MSKVIRISEQDLKILEEYRQYLIRKIFQENSNDIIKMDVYWNIRKCSTSELVHFVCVSLDGRYHFGLIPDSK